MGFSRLDDGSGVGYITRFYINRLIHQGIVCREGTDNSKIYVNDDKNFRIDYQKPLFKLPGSSDSKLERFVYNLLKENYPLSKIHTEYKFEDGRYLGSKSQFRYDFLLETTDGKHLLIETDGEQHFQFIPNWHKTRENFKEKQNRDIFKNDFAKQKNIKLLRIAYKDNNSTEINNLLDYSLDNKTKEPIIYSKSYSIF